MSPNELSARALSASKCWICCSEEVYCQHLLMVDNCTPARRAPALQSTTFQQSLCERLASSPSLPTWERTIT